MMNNSPSGTMPKSPVLRQGPSGAPDVGVARRPPNVHSVRVGLRQYPMSELFCYIHRSSIYLRPRQAFSKSVQVHAVVDECVRGGIRLLVGALMSPAVRPVAAAPRREDAPRGGRG